MSRVILITIAIVMVLPFLFMFSGSLQNILGAGSQVGAVLRIIPPRASLSNYLEILRLPLFPVMLMNSAVLVVGYVIPCLLINGLSAYALVFHKFKWKKIYYFIALATLSIPTSSLIIPRYITMRWMGLSGLSVVILMCAFSALTMFMLRNYFENIPSSLVEIARMDGAGDWTIFSKIILPLSKPVIGAIIVFQGIAGLSDYMWQSVNLPTPWQQPLIIGLYNSIYERYNAQRQGGIVFISDFGYELTVGTVLAIPMILIFLFTSRYFVGGLTVGAVKE